LLNGCSLPVPRVEQLRLQPPEEALTGGMSGEHPLRDIERINFALCILESHPRPSDSGRHDQSERQAGPPPLATVSMAASNIVFTRSASGRRADVRLSPANALPELDIKLDCSNAVFV